MKKKDLAIVYVNVDDLRPAEINPRAATKDELNQVKTSIQKYGFVDPLIVNGAENRKNVIIGGHLRWKIAKELGMKEVPVVYVNIPDLEQERELLLRLNRNTGHWDFKLLQNFGINLLKDIGFKPFEIDKAFHSLQLSSFYESKPFGSVQYEPQLDRKVRIMELYDDSLTQKLIEQIEQTDFSEEEKKFLTAAAQRFTEFNFDLIAEYFAQSKNQALKKWFERLALVIIDYDDALQTGWKKLIDRLIDGQKEYT